MIKELFSSMHELLDYIIQHYSSADAEEREEYCYRIQELKETNDSFIDHWVSFEEKLALFFETYRASLPENEKNDDVLHDILYCDIETATEISEGQSVNESNHFNCDEYIPIEIEGLLDQSQGYYKLFMFQEAAELLSQILTIEPECNVARLYYGMTLMHLRNWSEAQRQFQLLIVLSDIPKWLALSYNALGCIQAIHMHLNQAEALFMKAYEVYPQFEDSLRNLQCCMETPQQLSLYFGSTELCCM